MRKGLIVAGWLAATAATTAVAYVAVGAAGERVNDRPLSVVVAESTTTSSLPAPTTSTTSPTVTSATTTPSTSTTPPTTTSPPTTSAPTAPPTTTAWKQQTIASTGGTVVVSFRGEEVRLESVAAAAGYSYSIEDDGPGEVRVEFEGPLRVEVRARVRDGQLIVEIDEDD